MKSKIPASLYRLQLNPYFPFDKAERYLSYFKKLGVDGLYLSPILQAYPKSMHGYDLIDPLQISFDLGGEKAYIAFSEKMREEGLLQVLDIVANHMSASTYNPWWNDVLEKGKASAFASFFDIDFDPPRNDLKGKVLMPILNTTLKEAIEMGEIKVVKNNGAIYIRYENFYLPCNRDTYSIAEEVTAELLLKQNYLLTYWQEGPTHINYRRFFDINELAALKIENRELFDLLHEKSFELVKRGYVQGFRIDHPDGFLDPKEYFDRLREKGPNLIIVEKILSENEKLPENWKVDGTVGYDYLNDLNALFVNKKAEKAFTELYHEFIGETIDPQKLLFQLKKTFALVNMRSEINGLKRFQPDLEEETIAELLSHMEVYRTYFTNHDSAAGENDKKNLNKALQKTGIKGKNLSQEFLLRFQQLTPPIMAKGFEDTFFYRYNRLVSLNEVGGNPLVFGRSVDEFHTKNIERLKKWPYSLITTSTHDTKRSEDARMRINVLTEDPEKWREMVFQWSGINQIFKTKLKEIAAPESNFEYLLYQNLLAIYPESGAPPNDFFERFKNFLYKAMRENKSYTSWINHNDTYEYAVILFAQSILNHPPFMKSFVPYVREISKKARLMSFSALLIKLASPGILDIYQGTDFFDYSLVDPDNRRLVDFEKRQTKLSELNRKASLLEYDDWKLSLLSGGLHLRKKHPELFLKGEYLPIKVSSNYIAFERRYKEISLITLAPIRVSSEKEVILKSLTKEYKNIFTYFDSIFPDSSLFGMFLKNNTHREFRTF